MEASENKNFRFDPNFDSEFLWELYQDDYQTIENLFSVSLEHFDTDLAEITGAYDRNDRQQLLKSLHKFKPTFGFLGLPQVQEDCKNYEDLCRKNEDLNSGSAVYKDLISTILNSKQLLEKTYLQLKEYNTQFL
ncbi:Hpt domain-containing protein [Gynurincola endophyticus]|uniref:Hpt domain-containing protein n=1 Tax=Gynurincola endophyticus TaxID=2479004 RepID=UPI000F8D4241|nr:Hpt domain-containing protein [Gynurincola endophyticus]